MAICLLGSHATDLQVCLIFNQKIKIIAKLVLHKWITNCIYNVSTYILGDIKRESNPTFYRSPSEYFAILQHNIYEDSRKHKFTFLCERALSIEAYIRVRKRTIFKFSYT